MSPVAQRIVSKILEDLKDRAGFDSVWNSLPPDIRLLIENCWIELAAREIPALEQQKAEPPASLNASLESIAKSLKVLEPIGGFFAERPYGHVSGAEEIEDSLRILANNSCED